MSRRKIVWALFWIGVLGSNAIGQGRREPVIFQDADVAIGENLLREHRCAECHARRVGGDGNSIYRPQGRINTAGALRGMVEYCNTELGLAMFPEEVTGVAAVLNRDHYRFK